MSLRTALAPHVTSVLFGTRTRDLRRRVAETMRFLRGKPHQVHYFHQVDDPYSHLAAQLLEPFLERYDVELDVHLVSPPEDAAAPDRERLVAYSRVDAARIAEARGLAFRDPGAQPDPELVARATRILAAASSPRAFDALAPRVGEALWDSDEETLKALEHDQEGAGGDDDVKATLARGDALRKRLGHYLGAVFHYAGESYWGVDRLGYLEDRLADLGAIRRDGPMLAPRIDVSGEPIDAVGTGLTLEFFVSLRSPYSYLAMPRTFELARRSGVALVLRPVLPMVMRGLAVPASKRMYIATDTKREAESIGMPFGRICDPVGRPVERAFSLYPYAVAHERGGEFLLSFCRGVFAEGIDAGSDDGLRRIVESAGLSWEEAWASADEDGWRPELEANREAMLAVGLWGVPSYRLRGPAGHEDFCTWGQDRIWLVEDEIRRRAGGAI